jgi:hypothetical protein
LSPPCVVSNELDAAITLQHAISRMLSLGLAVQGIRNEANVFDFNPSESKRKDDKFESKMKWD